MRYGIALIGLNEFIQLKFNSLYRSVATCFIAIGLSMFVAQVSWAQSKSAAKSKTSSTTKSGTSKSTANKKSTSTKSNSDQAANQPNDGKSAPTPVNSKFSLSRFYHDVTCHYNYWYNANMKMDLAVDRLKEANADDYTKILPLYAYDTEGGSGSVGPDMDEVIKKTSVGIQLHEKSVWVPDCYYLMARAYYFKKEYKDAQDVLQFIQTNYKIKSVKGVAVPEKRFAHKSITNESLLWLIKNYIMQGKYEEAEAITKDVEARKDFPVKLKDELKILHTYVLIRKEEYAQAVIPLTNAITLTKKKADKTRYTYILAQLHEYSKNSGEAIKTYKRVLAMNPEFVMDFNARMKIVELYAAQPNLPVNEVRSILYGMLNDSKYSDYKDQVYFRLAELELKQKNEKGAISFLRQSIAVSTTNVEQKGLSNKRLADIYFGNPKYILAKNRYDSAFQYLPATHPEYPIVAERKDVLTEVVARIRIIQKEDSLQKLAAMKPADLEKKLMRDLAKKQAKALNDSLDKLSNNKANTDNNLQDNNAGVAGGFYFYNQGIKGSGYNDFIKKWGNRPLADDWRRAKKNQKATALNTNPEGDKNNTDTTSENSSTGKNSELDKLMTDIPLSEGKLSASNDKIILAYFELANLYKERLKNDKKAIETFEKLIQRYPKNKYLQESYYNLYLLYDKVSNYALSEKYKNKILDEFPNSAFAKVIKNPNFINEQNKKKNAVNDYYAATYELYQDEKYADVIKRADDATELYKGSPVLPKFQLLKALAIGHTRDIQEFTASLNTVITNNPNTDVKTKAQEILTAITAKDKGKPTDFHPDTNNTNSNASNSNQEAEKPTGLTYNYEPNAPHYFLIVFTKLNPKNAQVMGNVSNFNSKNHSLDNLSVDPQLLTTDMQLAVVKTFPNADKAFEFMDEIDEEEKAIFKGMGKDQYATIIISQANFALLQKDGDFEAYRSFFEEKYQMP